MSQIVEIAVELMEPEDLELLKSYLYDFDCAFYVEPPREPPFKTLEEVEMSCEGK